MVNDETAAADARLAAIVPLVRRSFPGPVGDPFTDAPTGRRVVTWRSVRPKGTVTLSTAMVDTEVAVRIEVEAERARAARGKGA